MPDELDPRDIPLQPANDLEGVMVQVAGGVREEAELFRALADAELLVPQPGEEGPLRELPATPGAEVALPVVEVGGQRAVPAYTSEEQLRLAPPSGWTGFLRLPAQTLAAMLPTDGQVVLNPTGQLSTLVPVTRLREPELPPGVRTLDENRPIAAGEPEEEDERSLDAVRAWAQGRPEVRAAYRALYQPEGDPAPRPAVGLLLAPGADAREILGAAVRELQGRVDPALDVLPIDPEDPGLLARFMLERTQPFYTRS
jgi:SseB protein N-terminal domain/SseB protein C-terminal domain